MKKRILLIILFLGISFFIGGLYFYYEPKISLLGDEEVTLTIGQAYIETDATIDFLFDVDKYIEINGSVDNQVVGEYTLSYTAKLPYFKKSSSVSRIVRVIDVDAPMITLIGNDVSMYVGDTYKEPGYKAIDGIDGILTESVKVENNIDNKVVGEYEVSYSVEDTSGNETIKLRKVIVKERPTTTTTTTTTSTPTTKKSNGKSIAILMYHYFYDPDAGEDGKNANYMSVKDFDTQMKYLSDNNYYFPSWSEVADFIDGKINLPAKSIVITVDDGQTSFFKYAIPILNKYNIKATSFIITSKAGGTKFKNYAFDNINYESHTHEMHTGGCSGGHGGLFRCVNYDKGVADLKKSIEILGSNDVIAYPFGDVTDNVLNITKSAGFKVGVTTVNKKAQVGMDKLQLPRVRMSKGISLNTFISSI